MATVSLTTQLTVPRTPVPLKEIRFVLQRDGELATGRRILRFYRSWGEIAQLCMVFEDEGGGDGVATQVYRVPLAVLLAQGEWLAIGVDDNAPRKTRALYLALSEEGTYTFNISQGEAGSGVPAELDAVVKVDGVLANREVVVLERPDDGTWRVAGFGNAVDGALTVELRTLQGDHYAVALDDYGIAFTPDLVVTVGQRIRPQPFAGWLYEVTEAGTLPANEPDWWLPDGDNAPRMLGTARAVVVRYHRPLAHGPVPVETI